MEACLAVAERRKEAIKPVTHEQICPKDDAHCSFKRNDLAHAHSNCDTGHGGAVLDDGSYDQPGNDASQRILAHGS